MSRYHNDGKEDCPIPGFERVTSGVMPRYLQGKKFGERLDYICPVRLTNLARNSMDLQEQVNYHLPARFMKLEHLARELAQLGLDFREKCLRDFG
ncbi:MAG: hypothetical protein NTX52_06425 [Planctomycetota bacterium]|nr:hypothetical protein [Planctomycetota bacterium]